MRMLSVSDDQKTLNALKSFFEDRFNINTLDIADGVPIHCKAQKYDVLVIDKDVIKGRSASEVVLEVRRDERNFSKPRMGIVVLSTDELSRRIWSTMGADAILKKPLAIEECTSAVETAIARY